MRMPRTITPVILASAALLAACGGNGDGGGVTEPPPGNGNTEPPPSSAQVAMVSDSDEYGDDYHVFQPSEVTIQEGGTVTWSNGSGVLHNVTFAAQTGAPASIANRDSGSESRTFDSAGSFDYSCTNHIGMTGRVVVVED